MGDYLNFIRDMPIDGKIGRRVVARLATYRALGITRVDPEEVAKQAVWDEINAMPAVRRYHGEYVPQEPQDIRSSVAPVMAAPVAKSERVITLPSRVTVKASEQPAPTLINVTCPQCGREKPINPTTQQPIEDARGRRFVETKCPNCGATFKAQLPAEPEPMQSSDGDLGGGVYLSETEAARHPWR